MDNTGQSIILPQYLIQTFFIIYFKNLSMPWFDQNKNILIYQLHQIELNSVNIFISLNKVFILPLIGTVKKTAKTYIM